MARARGERLADRYRLEEPLGRGGMGEVWRAHDELLERPVAVKFAHLANLTDTGKLRTEAVNAARLHHPNIVAVFDFVEEGDTCMIVLEYVAAPSLARIVAERGPLSPEEAGAIGCQIADALAASHAQSVVHGDVTPENILVRPDGVAKLTDFGISRALWSEPTYDGTRAVGVHGKPSYLPPEVAQGRPLVKASDVFALGATLYAAVEGHSPYGKGRTPQKYVELAAGAVIEEPRRAGRLREPLLALTSADPDERPDAAGARRLLGNAAPLPAQVQERLHEERTLIDATLTMRLRPAPEQRRSPRGFPSLGGARRPWALAAGSAAVVAALLAGLFAARPWDGSPGDSGKDAKGAPAAAKDAGRMGEVTSADPCGLLSATTFRKYGDAHVDPDYGELDRCDVLITKGDDDAGDITLDFASHPAEPDSQTRVRKAGAVKVVEGPSEDGECDRDILLPDGNEVLITGEVLKDPMPDPCTLASLAADHAADILNHGPVPRRPGPFPADSLARLNACDLLDAADLKAFPAIDPDTMDPEFADWACTWSSDTSGKAEVYLLFNRDDDLTDNGTRATLGGKPAYVDPGGEGDHTCVVSSVHRTYTDTAGEETIEHLYLKTTGQESDEKLCDTAKALTTAVVRKIQKP
ncbi:serine/threonine-protein kinase [Streptomyces sp. TS71-3]|uniref:serine/threonine-protein kinase n=1 Tax=Streptomyces sp. TS71-3 TaxID=2733862 RepID=UPI001B006FB0|nr:serine/threonine-protein kinase [Streptomyces sp. TS71-3]GHJ41765.1 hypothetical protein Sm713_73740 [Streptomyces sp. TS71-3]